MREGRKSAKYSPQLRSHLGNPGLDQLSGAAASQAGAYPQPGQYPQQPVRQQLAFGYTTQPQQGYAYQTPAYAPSTSGDMAQQQPLDPRYERQVIEYPGAEKPGTIIVDTPHFFLYLVLDGGRALRYGIGVGRPGFTWAGVKSVSAKREWPDWRPPDEMLARRPDLPHYMPGGRTIRSAHARSISARRSIGSTVRTSLGRSARRCRGVHPA